jgi:hypothetical protein
MPRGRALAPVQLDDSEREALQAWTRRRTTAQGLARRAQIAFRR